MNRYLTSHSLSHNPEYLAIPLRAANKPRAGKTEKNHGAMDERRP